MMRWGPPSCRSAQGRAPGVAPEGTRAGLCGGTLLDWLKPEQRGQADSIRSAATVVSGAPRGTRAEIDSRASPISSRPAAKVQLSSAADAAGPIAGQGPRVMAASRCRVARGTSAPAVVTPTHEGAVRERAQAPDGPAVAMAKAALDKARKGSSACPTILWRRISHASGSWRITGSMDLQAVIAEGEARVRVVLCARLKSERRGPSNRSPCTAFRRCRRRCRRSRAHDKGGAPHRCAEQSQGISMGYRSF